MADTSVTPSDRIRIFDRGGNPIAEFRATVSRSWLIGDEGRCSFTYPTRKTQVVNDEVLRFGNWILIQNTQLPPWVGMLDTPRQWSSRNVTVSGYTPEHLFGHRIGPPEEMLTGSAGTIFESLIARVNLAEQTILRAGNIWRGGPQRQEIVNPVPLNETLKTLWERSGEDYTWVPNVGTSGRLTIHGNWLQFLGYEPGIRLHEGKGGGNIEAAGRILIEDGPVYNSIFAYGDGETWKSKASANASNTASIGRYGLREQSEEFSGTTSLTTLAATAAQRLREFAQPARSFTLNALNVGDTFKYISLGSIYTVRFENIGFYGGALGYAGRVRIIGMSYNPDVRNKINLVVREVV
jgi:hypothetical protein